MTAADGLEVLAAEAERLGVALDPEARTRFAQYLVLLEEWRERAGLTTVVDADEVQRRHFGEALALLSVVRALPELASGTEPVALADLGSGAGFPGLPVAIAAPDSRVVLLDSTRKRVDFLARSIEALGVRNASAVWDRAEEHLARNTYDVVLIRAVSSVRENVRMLRKVRHSHKDLVMLKGPSWGREVRAGEREAERLGFRLDTVWEHKLPEGMGDRAILVYRAPGAQGT